ncbi:sodium-independent sulfate anion transporter [Cimex lectularius]|uniref:Sodium-independent sulfate anion transporter n=1 Tax=Cimex lectularius TaxID=79782 RepID=A0A8I6TE78_CIMLE|nr:sodium-independent sulfate anion transporter [Cimex lectularius]
MHFSLRHYLHYIPLLQWLSTYKREYVIPDIIAGLTVGIMMIPQSIAYTTLVGIRPQYGLYTSIAGGISYAVFGNVRQATIGPSAILTLLSYQFAHEENPELIALITFLIGITVLLFGFFKLGFVIDFVSTPVISGYTSAVTLVIFASQIKGLLGIKFKAENFLSTICKLVSNIKYTRVPDATLGICCFLFLMSFKQIKKWKYLKDSKGFFYLSVAKCALTVFVSTLIAVCFDKNGQQPFSITGNITGGLPPVRLPNFTPMFDGEKQSFYQILSKLSLGLPTITCIAIITMIVIGKAYTKGRQLNTTYEILALGGSNVLGSFIGSMPVTGSFSRSAVNNSCDVKTPISGIYSAVLVILACAILTPYFYFIPKATLAAVVMSAVISMLEFEIILPLWKTNRKDLIPLCGTFFSSLLLGVEKGLICGLLFDLVFILYYNARPSIYVYNIQQNNENFCVITPRNGLLYPVANYLHEKVVVHSNVLQKEKITGYVLNMIHIAHLDYTSIQTIKSIMNDLLINNKELILTNPRKSLRPIIQEVLPKIRILDNLNFQHNEV